MAFTRLRMLSRIAAASFHAFTAAPAGPIPHRTVVLKSLDLNLKRVHLFSLARVFEPVDNAVLPELRIRICAMKTLRCHHNVSRSVHRRTLSLFILE